MQYEVYARTDQGRIRQNNEDNFYLHGAIREDVSQAQMELEGKYEGGRLLFAVCDGMGGEEQGELASLVAVKSLSVDEGEDVYAEARRNVNAANDAVIEKQRQFDTKHIGTTIAALAIDGDKGLAYNLGDSRVYCFREELRQLTQDHSMLNYLIEIGILDAEQAKATVNKNSLMKYLGINCEYEIEPFFSDEMQIMSGDIFLLCSDGLWDMLDDDEISSIMKSGGSSREICNGLVDNALRAGGIDNVTAVIIKAKA